MRVLVAVDGSAGSQLAASLVHRLAWPPSTTVTLVSVVDPGAWIPPGPGVPGSGGLVREDEVAAYYQGHQSAISADLERSGLTVDSRVVEGRPADSLIAESRRIGADVVVVGSRGHGRLAALLLGSVSAAIVDRAPCSVLVARGSSVTRIVLAVDGSRSARSAAQLAASWPALAAAPITVVAVSESERPWTSRISTAFQARGRRRGTHPRGDAPPEAEQIAHEATAGLQRAGRTATADVRHGEVASEIITAAREHQADLVVIGCRGRTSLRTIVLGSVARDVVLASEASVMVVRARRGAGKRP